MTVNCNETCHKYKVGKPLGVNSRYMLGQKRCSICSLFIKWEGKNCPCCGILLRTRPKGNLTRHQYMTILQVKRV